MESNTNLFDEYVSSPLPAFPPSVALKKKANSYIIWDQSKEDIFITSVYRRRPFLKKKGESDKVTERWELVANDCMQHAEFINALNP